MRGQHKVDRKLNILLSNGRFPVTLDLARQLRLAGHRVFVVDCMHYHVCKFSAAVARSFRVPVPRDDPGGFVAGVLDAIATAKIDLLIPMHEEILFLAEAAQTNPGLHARLLAPPFQTLVTLHNKWEFSRFMSKNGLRVPSFTLCQSYNDVENLDRSREWAVKPVYGRASTSVFHLKSDEEAPSPAVLDVGPENHYIAQEWTEGQRYCTYSVLQDGGVAALAAYPVKDTIDGSSCVYFEAIEKAEITDYVDRFAACLPGVSGQLALDLVEGADGSLTALECNPRATSGIHLYSGTTRLAEAMACHLPVDAPLKPGVLPDHIPAPAKAKRKVAPGMLMWKRSRRSGKRAEIVREYAGHMKRLVSSRDVIWSSRDLLPSIMQPFLLTSYYEICREKKLKLPTMFQYDLVWEPKGAYLRQIRQMFEGDCEEQSDTS